MRPGRNDGGAFGGKGTEAGSAAAGVDGGAGADGVASDWTGTGSAGRAAVEKLLESGVDPAGEARVFFFSLGNVLDDEQVDRIEGLEREVDDLGVGGTLAAERTRLTRPPCGGRSRSPL